MKALSIRQPWAWLIVRPDITDPSERARAFAAEEIKPLENRDWEGCPGWRQFRGPFKIHASIGMTKSEYDFCQRFISEFTNIKLPTFDELPRGGIVGQSVIYDCVKESLSNWFMGDYALLLRDTKPLPFQKFKGALGFFEVP
ncbi:MAG: hypothetical protein C4586_08430 [Anaerolineaceae bacterium]|nr:MAG: hypothetical protein C4586_08430 [Anaerolineaceae bacterium]